MENKNNKNDFPSGKDDFNIKDHLNASFDMEKITVSEDLIARTLKKVQESEEIINTETKKRKVIPMRRYVGAAAAVLLVVVIGTALVKTGTLNMGVGYKANNEANSEAGMLDENPSLYATEDSAKSDLSAKQSRTETRNESAVPNEEKISADNASASEREEKSFALAADQVFSQLFPVGNYEEIKTFTMTKVTDDEKVLILTGDKAEGLYTLLDQYRLTQDVQTEKAVLSYIAEIVTGDGQTITLTFQEGLKVTHKAESLNAEYFYIINDWDDFIKKLDDFFSSME